MLLLDTNLFVIDRFFPRDERYDVNRQFIAKLPDAALVKAAEDYGVEAIVTWNKKHFENRTLIKVLTPEEYLTAYN